MRACAKLLLAILLPLAGAACSTIHFNQDPAESGRAPQFTEWHHNAVLQLVEVSAPVDMSQRCTDGEWTRITTELTFPGALAHHVTSSLWTPWSVSYRCAR